MCPWWLRSVFGLKLCVCWRDGLLAALPQVGAAAAAVVVLHGMQALVQPPCFVVEHVVAQHV